MTKKAKHVCEYCLGVITAPARTTLERTVAIHIENCPAAHRGRKAIKTVEPPVLEAPRKRVIPRQVLSD